MSRIYDSRIRSVEVASVAIVVVVVWVWIGEKSNLSLATDTKPSVVVLTVTDHLTCHHHGDLLPGIRRACQRALILILV